MSHIVTQDTDDLNKGMADMITEFLKAKKREEERELWGTVDEETEHSISKDLQ